MPGGGPRCPLPQRLLELGGWFRDERIAFQCAPRGVLPQIPAPQAREGLLLVSVWAAGNPHQVPVCLPFLHPRSPHGFARSRSQSPAVPASVPRSTPSWCRRGTWREATSWAEVRELRWCYSAEWGRVGKAPRIP